MRDTAKHAYLVMAHTDPALLDQLLEALDDERNDIFLHIDKKADMDISQLYRPRRAGMDLIPRINVNWGGDSQIECELELLRCAVPGHYAYYHLCSGADLPIKSQDEIHSFFDRSDGKNYIKIDKGGNGSDQWRYRVERYHFLQDKIGRNCGKYIGFMEKVECFLLSVQKLLGVDRLKRCPMALYKGSNWFSITDEMARYILQSEDRIRRYFYRSLCADELFLQTIAMNGPLRDTIVDDDLRYIDWERGSPYTFTIEDLELLSSVPDFFARKFSTEKDPAIVEAVMGALVKKS